MKSKYRVSLLFWCGRHRYKSLLLEDVKLTKLKNCLMIKWNERKYLNMKIILGGSCFPILFTCKSKSSTGLMLHQIYN